MNTRLKFADTYKAKYNRFRSKKLLAYQQLYHILVVIFYTPLARIFRLSSSIYVNKRHAPKVCVRAEESNASSWAGVGTMGTQVKSKNCN